MLHAPGFQQTAGMVIVNKAVLVRGLFVRSLVGLDRAAAKELFNEFLSTGTATADRIEFLNLLIDHLTEQGVLEAARLFESPFTDVSPAGPEALFSEAQIDRIAGVLRDVRANAA